MIGEIIFSLVGVLNTFNYLPADGSCLKIIEYQELDKILHDEKGNYPYGKCNDYELRLPDLKNNTASTLYIRVK